MMSMTHLSVGLATSVAILSPNSFADYLPVFAGASVGSIICDFDCRSNKYMRDALYGRLTAFVLFAIAIIIDIIIKGKMYNSFFKHDKKLFIIGLVGFGITSLCAVFSEHRSFSHSILALILYGISLYFACFPLLLPFVIGYVTHDLLDLMNKKPVYFLFPSENGYCLNWFIANGGANIFFLVLGCVGLIAAIIINIAL